MVKMPLRQAHSASTGHRHLQLKARAASYEVVLNNPAPFEFTTIPPPPPKKEENENNPIFKFPIPPTNVRMSDEISYSGIVSTLHVLCNVEHAI